MCKEQPHGQISVGLDCGRAGLCAGVSLGAVLMPGKPVTEPKRQLPSDRERENRGETRIQRNQRSEPRLPHERDESSSSQGGTNDPRIEQASRDIKNGQMDTGRSPVVDELARKHFPSGKDEVGKPNNVRTRAAPAGKSKSGQ